MFTVFFLNLPPWVMKLNKPQQEEFLKKLGKRIADLRKEARYSQTEFALLCDKDKQSLNRLEKGKTNPTILTLFEIASQLSIPLREIFK